ncbi:hypothetical protein [Candidatus Berkiella aquae]|nr:hypothetical protein [Candidatus Berkiella aquae]MCS5712693.1 hypothetical protein [Candidatus Berkiella aquae]
MTNTYHYLCQEKLIKTRDISLITIVPISHALTYQAGQFVEILLRSGHCLLLSIANAPQTDGHIEFHLRHDEAHPIAKLFLNELEQDANVVLRGPFGESTLEQNIQSQEELVFLAGGTGFAPIKALLQLALVNSQQPLLLYWGIRRPEDAYDEPLLQQWKTRYPRFDYTLVLSEPHQHPSWTAPTGFVHDYVAQKHPDMKALCLFASGPFEMIQAAQRLFTHQGLKTHRFISDMLPKTIKTI